MLVGQTGSGKSTFVQQINALLRPTKGRVLVGNRLISAHVSRQTIRSLRKTVGLVFQVPQDQLFGETVADDLAFGPRNFHFSSAEVKLAVKFGVKLAGIPENWLNRSPFDLSGGQMERVAIAGVLACRPQVLILDEPTVGLDSQGTTEVMSRLSELRRRFRLTVIMVTHRMDLVAKYATRVLVLNRGRLIANRPPRELFSDLKLLKVADLGMPFSPRFAIKLARRGLKLPRLPLDQRELARELARLLK